MKSIKAILAIAVVFTVSVLTSCTKTCTDQYGNAIACQQYTNNQQYNPGGAPVGDPGETQYGYFKPDIDQLAFGIGGKTSALQCIKDFDQTGYPDAGPYPGTADINGVHVAGRYSFDDINPAGSGTCVCDAQLLIEWYADYLRTGIVKSRRVKINWTRPYGYFGNPNSVSVNVSLRGIDATAGIFITPL